MLTYILTAIFFLSTAYLLWMSYMRSNKIKELMSKTDFAVSNDQLLKIEFESDNELKHIAENFNSLSNRYLEQKMHSKDMGALQSKHQELSGMVDVFESSISQITLITDIGKDITSSLGLREILSKVFKYINSTMISDEVHFMVEKHKVKQYFVLSGKNLEHITKTEWTSDKDNVLNWTYLNGKEIMLQNAMQDFEQFVFKPIHLYNSQAASSVICIPFGFNTKQTGSLAVYSTKQNAFDNYHIDFVKSLASYIAVAIDNSTLFEELDEEKKKSDGLLLNILPEGVADELKQRGSIEPKQFNHVSVLFTDMVNFTGISEKMSPTELVQEIHRNFTAYDAIIEKHGLEKIKTIGDAYLAVCGMPNETPDHAERIVRAAKDIVEYMGNTNGRFQIRVGVNSGPVVAGIVGVKKYAYDIWGDTVNTAARMEQNSEAGKINISGSTYELVKDKFNCVHRGKISAKNKGEIDMYFVV